MGSHANAGRNQFTRFRVTGRRKGERKSGPETSRSTSYGKGLRGYKLPQASRLAAGQFSLLTVRFHTDDVRTLFLATINIYVDTYRLHLFQCL